MKLLVSILSESYSFYVLTKSYYSTISLHYKISPSLVCVSLLKNASKENMNSRTVKSFLSDFNFISPHFSVA